MKLCERESHPAGLCDSLPTVRREGFVELLSLAPRVKEIRNIIVIHGNDDDDDDDFSRLYFCDSPIPQRTQ